MRLKWKSAGDADMSICRDANDANDVKPEEGSASEDVFVVKMRALRALTSIAETCS